MSIFNRLFGGSSTPAASQQLTMSKYGGELGVLKDKTGTVRGFWFRDEAKAFDVMAVIAMCGTKGDTVEQSDYIACSTGLCRVKSADGGYLVVFPSAKF
jgi:hypothetical protein